MALSIMVPHFPALGSKGMPPVPPTILMSELNTVISNFDQETKVFQFQL